MQKHGVRCFPPRHGIIGDGTIKYALTRIIIHCKFLYIFMRPATCLCVQLKELNHDNIKPFIGACVEPEHMCYLMQWCSRGTVQVCLYKWKSLFTKNGRCICDVLSVNKALAYNAGFQNGMFRHSITFSPLYPHLFLSFPYPSPLLSPHAFPSPLFPPYVPKIQFVVEDLT